MHILLTLITLLTLGCVHAPTPASAKTLKVDPERLVSIIGRVDGSILEQAAKVTALSAANKKPIYILLNSPGGAVDPGTSFIDSILSARAAGVKVICFSGVYAYSMAFNIMVYCNKRYTFANTKLMFHPISISTRGQKAYKLGTWLSKLLKLEARLKSDMRKALNVTSKEHNKHYNAETIWHASELADWSKPFITIVSRIEGVPNLFAVTKPSNSPFGHQQNPPKQIQRPNTVTPETRVR